jgi:hypothetical protein
MVVLGIIIVLIKMLKPTIHAERRICMEDYGLYGGWTGVCDALRSHRPHEEGSINRYSILWQNSKTAQYVYYG